MRRIAAAVAVLVWVGACGGEEEPTTPSGVEAFEMGTDAEFYDICFTDEMNGWISGGSPFVKGGIIGRTRDGGETWDYESGVATQRKSSFLFHMHAIHAFDTLVACAVGSGGEILRTDDGGASWDRRRRSGIARHLLDLDFIDANRGWAVGLHGVIHTEDGGLSWDRIDEDDISAHAIDFVDMFRGWVSGQHGDLRCTFDGGKTWEQVPVFRGDHQPYLFEIHFVDADHGWVVGEDATILHTRDGGETWAQQDPGVRAFLSAVAFVDPRHGWVTGYNRNNGMSYVLKTIDGGTTWEPVTEVYGEEFRALDVVGSTGWVAGDRTRDGAQTLIRFDASTEPTL